MDYPIIRKSGINVSDDWWFTPTDPHSRGTDGTGGPGEPATLRSSPILAYLDRINHRDKFLYLMIILCVIVLLTRLHLTWTIWIGILVGLFVVYYFNERNVQELNGDANQLWSVLKSPLLNTTKYFITDPELIQWIDDVKEYKTLNTLEFNKMVAGLDRFLKLSYDIKIGVAQCRENLDLIRDLKTECLNQFHSMVYRIENADIRDKYGVLLQQLGVLLNQRYHELTKICQLYYTMNPITIDSHMDVTMTDEPMANDTSYDPHYNFYT